MIRPYVSAHNHYPSSLTDLTNDLTRPQCQFSLQNGITILRFPNEVVLHVIHRMSAFAISLTHLPHPIKREIVPQGAFYVLKAVPPKGEGFQPGTWK